MINIYIDEEKSKLIVQIYEDDKYRLHIYNNPDFSKISELE